MKIGSKFLGSVFVFRGWAEKRLIWVSARNRNVILFVFFIVLKGVALLIACDILYFCVGICVRVIICSYRGWGVGNVSFFTALRQSG